jgi:putative transposase
LDVFSSKIVGREVYETENGELDADLLQKACRWVHVTDFHKPLIMYSDNGSPMKAATFLEAV